MPLDTRTKDSQGNKKKDQKVYSFSTLIASVFLLAMILVSGLVIMTSYWGTKGVVNYTVAQLSDRTKLIAKLTFREYTQRASDVEQLLVSSETLAFSMQNKNRTQQEKILSEVYFSHQDGRLDLLFVQNGHDASDIINVSQTAFTTENLIEKAVSVPRSNYKNYLIVDQQADDTLYAIINKSAIVAENTGRVLGYSYTGLILNDNIGVLDGIQKNTKAQSVYLLYQDRDIASLYAIENREENTGRAYTEKDQNLLISTDLPVTTPDMHNLRLKISHPQRAIKILEHEYFYMTYKVSLFVIMIVLITFFILKWLTRYATFSLTNYAASITQDKKRAHFQPTKIREFNEVGQALNDLMVETADAEDKILQSNRELEKLARIASAAKDDLKKTNTDLENANRELEEFAYRTSHDLRSPLVSSIALLDVAEKACNERDEKTAKKSINMIRDSLSQLEILIRDILILNELKHREEPYEKVKIKGLIENSLQKLSTMENYDQITIETDYKCHDFYMKKLKGQMIIENLISNAIKYYDSQKKKPYIKISSFIEDDHYVLQVKDNGLGIPREKREKLFTMFSRLHPKVSFGSGLGLYLIKKGAETMGGNVRYKNHKDGSIFEFILPTARNNTIAMANTDNNKEEGRS